MTGSALKALTLAGASALVLAACAVGPQAPEPTLPASGQGAFLGAATAPVSGDMARDDWWRLYDDPVLDGLVAQALAENNDL